MFICFLSTRLIIVKVTQGFLNEKELISCRNGLWVFSTRLIVVKVTVICNIKIAVEKLLIFCVRCFPRLIIAKVTVLK